MEIQNISLSKIKGPAFHIRTETRDGDPELLASIKTHGIKQPVLLRPSKTGYQIIAGVRRYQACKKLGMKAVPAIVEKLDDKTTFEIMLTENIQRRQLTPMEEAHAFREYLDNYKGSIRELAKKINKSHAYIVQRLLMIDWMRELPKDVQKEMQDELGGYNVTTSHMEEMVKVKEPEKVREIAKAIREEKLTVPQTKEVVQLVEERQMPVDRAVQTVKIVERAKEAAEEVAEQLKEAVVKTSRDIKEAESSERRKLLENYMFLGSVIESLEKGRIFCVAHKSETPSLKWSCGTPLEETHEALKRKLDLRR